MSFSLAASSPSPLAGEVGVLFWAMAGGMVVFIGLLLEKMADWLNERFLGESYKPHKTLESVGWCILMAGIFVEIAVAGWSANDAWQTSQNTPAKMPVHSAFAIADFYVETNFDNPGTIWGSPGEAAAQLILSEKPISEQSTNDLQIVMTCEKPQCALVMTHPGTPENRWTMTLDFVMEPRDEYFSDKSLSKPAEELQNRLNFFTIHPHFLYGNTIRFFNGKVKFILNGSVAKTLILPVQTVDLNPMRAVGINPTNSAGIPAKWGFGNY